MANILILTAMPEELQPIIDFFQPATLKSPNENYVDPVYTQVVGENNIYYSNTRIGKVNASYTTYKLIKDLKIDLILNFGTAGGIKEGIEILDIVIGDKLAYHDVDVTAFGYLIGQVPNQNQYLETTSIDLLSPSFENAIHNDKDLQFHKGTILSGDQFISDAKDKIKFEEEFDNVYAVEMESTAIVDVCNKENVDVCVFRGISDLAHGESTVEFDYYLTKVSEKFNKILVLFFENIENITKYN